MVAQVEDSARKHVYAEASSVGLEQLMQAEGGRVMEDDYFVYKCSFYEQELSVVLLPVEAARGQGEKWEQGGVPCSDDLVL